jgi:hypothetical protein
VRKRTRRALLRIPVPFLREGWHFIPETWVTQWGLLRGAQDALEGV